MAPGAIFSHTADPCTANCALFNIVMVEFFDMKSNNVNNNHPEMFTRDHNSYSQRLGKSSLKLPLS